MVLNVSGFQTFPNMPFELNNTFIGHTDDVGDIDYDNFIPKMEEYKQDMSLDVGRPA